MFKKQNGQIFQKGGLHINEKFCWPLDKSIASLSTCHLGHCFECQSCSVLFSFVNWTFKLYIVTQFSIKVTLSFNM